MNQIRRPMWQPPELCTPNLTSSSFIILHHPSSSFIILHHPSSSFILHHPSSSFIILHHPLLKTLISRQPLIQTFSNSSPCRSVAHAKRLIRSIDRCIIALATLYRLNSVRRYVRGLFRYRTIIRRYSYFHRFPGHLRRLPFNLADISHLNLQGLEHYRTFRLYPDGLRNFVHLFQNDPVFISRGTKPQAPPLYQLGLVLFCLALSQGVRELSF